LDLVIWVNFSLHALLPEVSERESVYLSNIDNVIAFFCSHDVSLITYCHHLNAHTIHKGNFTTVPSIHIICSARGQSVSLDIKDMPDCIGKSCDESVLDSEENRKELANVLEQVLRCKCILSLFICRLLYCACIHMLNVSLFHVHLCHVK